MLLNTSVKIKK